MNSDVITIMGSNMAENHPVGFQWVMEARERGARVFHIDPRFTRTSAMATDWIGIRAGSDIAFLGGVVNYILENGRYFADYVRHYTNAPAIIDEEFQDTEDLDGLFSGWDPEKGKYDPTSWQYAGMEAHGAAGQREQGFKTRGEQSGHGGHGGGLEHGEPPEEDVTLQHPRCVFQLLKKHYARYTPELVSETCGCSVEQFVEYCEAVCESSGREKTGAFVYSVGWTQHTVGVQYIRTAAIIQQLLGNMGRPGGGVMALRGHASIQGSTDIPTLFNILPGYLPMPHTEKHETFQQWVDAIRHPEQKGFWGNAGAYATSLLKAYWGEHATRENDFCYGYLPRLTGDHGTYRQALDMIDRKIKGYFLLGQNPAVGSAHGRAQRLGMANLDWLVVRDLYEIESARFWKDGPEVDTGEIVPGECRTEVFLMPAASHVEKEGTFTQTQRMLQWREKAVDPPGDCRSELWFFYHLGRVIRQKLAESTDPRDRPVLDLTWDYPTGGEYDEPSAEAVLREINGYEVATGQPLANFTDLKDDGSTAGGCWIYTGVYKDGVNQAARRKSGREQDWVAREWGWAWPSDRRILYNRASADREGRPWSERKAYVWWDAQNAEWTGYDVPDFEKTKAPTYQPEEDSSGPAALAGDDPFVMQGDGKGWLYVPAGLVDGPLPTHYEPAETPVRNPLYGQQGNPTRKVYERPENLTNPSPPEEHGEVFPYVF